LSERSKKLLLAAVVLVAAGLATVLIAVSVAGGKDEPSAGTVHGVAETQALLEGIPQQGNVLGKPGAPVTIVEYADYQCPFCAQWAVDTLPAIVDEYVRPGNVKIVFQGIALLGEDSVTALQAAVSAGLQNKLWNVGELLFHNQGAENSGWVTDDLLRDIGASVQGLDVDAMMDGRESAEVADTIGAAQADAQAGGITGTPSFEITKAGGQPTLLQGAQPVDEFRQVLDGMLQDS
jgi:protein-disulfide isomerase